MAVLVGERFVWLIDNETLVQKLRDLRSASNFLEGLVAFSHTRLSNNRSVSLRCPGPHALN